MSQVLAALKKLFGHKVPVKTARRDFFRPRVDCLEDRRLMAVFIVDDDFTADNPAARRYDTIQEAVNAAAVPNGNSPGDTIIVRPGIYNEAVTIDKRVALVGAFAPSLTYIGSYQYPFNPSLNPNLGSIVDPASGAGFTVNANGVTIQGFTIANLDESLDTQGIVVNGVNSTRIFSNVIVDNTIGIALSTDTSNANVGAARTTYITGNTLRDNNTAGAAAGNGIYADAGVRNVVINGNKFTGHENASVILISDDVSTVNSNVSIIGNQMGNELSGETDSSIILANLVNSQVNGNVMRNLLFNAETQTGNGTGIFFAGGSSNVKVIGNDLKNGSFTGINVAFRPEDYFVATPNTNLLIQSNIVQNFGDGGIRLREGTSNSVVRANLVQGNGFGSTTEDVGEGFGSGITLEAAINNIVDQNTSYNNDADGFFADLASSGNTIRNNTGLYNGEHDFHDDSISEANPTLTANTYRANRGRTQNRNGLIQFFV